MIQKRFLAFSTTVKSGNPNWKSNSIGSIINQFKSICTIKTKSSGLDITLQPRFYDHIISSDMNQIVYVSILKIIQIIG